MFKRSSGAHKIAWYPKKASTAFSNGALVYADGSGAVQPADSTSGNHIGIMMKAVTSADSDYAETSKVMVDEVGPGDVFEVDVGNGTATSSLIGTFIDLHDSVSADVAATSKQVLLVVGFISSSKILVKVNASAGVKDVATS